MILVLAALFAAETFDLDMTSQDKKSTGVYKLRDQEKASLQQWIDTRYEKKGQPIAQRPAKAIKKFISENYFNGRFIRLSDNSLWEIRSQDMPITQGWISSVEILIASSENSEFPYKLTNSLTESSVFAKKASELPKALPPGR